MNGILIWILSRIKNEMYYRLMCMDVPMLLMQWINNISRIHSHWGNQRKHNSQTCKQNKFNKEFTQCSWATSPGPSFQWWPLYYVFKQSFYNNELDSSLTNIMKSVGMECTDSPYWNSTFEGHSSMTGPYRGACLNLSSLQWSTQTLWLSLALSGLMLPSGQLGFYSLFSAIGFLCL